MTGRRGYFAAEPSRAIGAARLSLAHYPLTDEVVNGPAVSSFTAALSAYPLLPVSSRLRVK